MKRFPVLLLVVVLLTQALTPVMAKELSAEEKEKKRQEILEQIRKKQAAQEKNKAKIQAKKKKTAVKQNIGEVIKKYENYLSSNCTSSKSNRCADALYSVSKLYYDKAREDYIKNQEYYEQAMDKWDRNPVGPEPIAPVPNYDKPLNSYLKAVNDYPNFSKAGEAYFQAGSIYMLKGDLEAATEQYERLVTKRPNDVRASAAHFRIAEICFTERDFGCALKHLNSMNDAHINDAIREMAHFRKAEIYYNRGDFDQSAKLFGQYIDKCDNLSYPKRDLRPEAMEYLAVSFSDMDNGAKAAMDYFSKVGRRSYEDTVIYAVGQKNYDHGQYEASIMALGHAIKKFPMFESAPQAQTNIVNSYVIRKKHEDANKAREGLVDTYGKGSQWATHNASNKVAVAKAELDVRKALGSIAIYYHAQAQASREPEKKSEWYAQALKRYNQFIKSYPDDKWAVYEYHYNAAEAYMTLAQFAKAAEYYDFVASANLSTYPKFKQDIDTIGLSAAEQEKMKNERKKSPVEISQMDAGFNAIVALDTLRKIETKKTNAKGAQAYQMPVTQNFLNYVRKFQQMFPKSPNGAEVLLLVADVAFEGEDFASTIKECDKVITLYGTKKDVYTRAMKLKADAYTKNKQYDLAVQTYDTLIVRSDKSSDEFQKYIDLAAGALFLKATALKTTGNRNGAATVFMNISTKYPESKVGDKAWFEAGAAYEEDSAFVEAAKTFTQLTRKFPKSKLVPQAFGRAGENWVKSGKYTEAGAVMELAGTTVKDTGFAIGALAKAAEYYNEAKLYEKSADMYYQAYKQFPTAENTPTALYNAGLAYEKAKVYPKAIEVYKILGSKYADKTDFAAEGYYSIGFCYQKMGKQKEMADAFVDYSNKFTNNRPKQINALLMATEAYREMGKLQEAETYVLLATKIYDKYHKKASISGEVGAKAFYIYGELNRAKLERIKLTGKNQKAVKAQLDKKVKALKPVLESYAEAIKQGVEEWTFKSTLAIGMTYVNFAEDLRNQKLFGSRDQKIAGKIQLVSGLEQYYNKAQENLVWNIETARKQNIRNNYVTQSEEAFMEMAYRKGRLLEEVGEIFRDAPIPAGLSEDEEMMYRDALDEKYLVALDAALPKYEEAIAAGQELSIGKNEWVDSVKSRIEYIDPTSPMMAVDLDAERAKVVKANVGADGQVISDLDAEINRQLDKALAEIAAVVNSEELKIDDKITRLHDIEAEAKRDALAEDEKIAEYKDILGIQ